MKIYNKILGIFNALILLVSIVALVTFTVEEKKWLITSLFIIPIYFYSHYLIATGFGFKKYEFSKKTGTITIILSAITFVLVGIIPIISWQNYKEIKIELETTKDWGQDTTLYNIQTEILKTKLVNNQLNYIFKARFDSERETPSIETFIVQFYDKDGFKLKTIQIDEWTTGYDSTTTKKVGITSHGQEYWNDEESYQEIFDYDVAIRWRK